MRVHERNWPSFWLRRSSATQAEIRRDLLERQHAQLHRLPADVRSVVLANCSTCRNAGSSTHFHDEVHLHYEHCTAQAPASGCIGMPASAWKFILDTTIWQTPRRAFRNHLTDRLTGREIRHVCG